MKDKIEEKLEFNDSFFLDLFLDSTYKSENDSARKKVEQVPISRLVGHSRSDQSSMKWARSWPARLICSFITTSESEIQK